MEDGTRVSRFQVRGSPPRVDAASEQVLITWLAGGHNGGCLAFGPDGYLYISTGDGGPAFPPDPRKSGQDVSNLLAAVLRIDVDRPDGARPYSIPPDNPFVQLAGARGEIWAYGFRNPWKMSFDPVTGHLWLGDVGWELWEMVYRVERGANYGWSLMEGPQPVHRERERGPTPIVPPTALHAHTEARSITGGHVYRGSRLPELTGAYVYGDYVTGKVWAVRSNGQTVLPPEELVDTPLPIICFGVGHDRELYLVSYDGTLHRLVQNEQAAANASFPKRLSETGLFASVRDHQVAPGVVPYGIVAEPWMDGAQAQRYIALPGTTQLAIHDSTNVQVGYIKNTWQFPCDAVLMKTISLETEVGDPATARKLETQILHFDVDTWRAYSYIWNDEQTDAVLADNRTTERSFPIRYRFVSRTECLLCHTTRGGSIYGFNPPQLDRDFNYGAVTDNQLRTLRHIGLFQEVAQEPSYKMVNPYDESADLESRARAYLHVNCAHCHRRGGGGSAAMDVQYHLKLDKTNLLQERPTQGTFGIHSPLVIVPGDPFRSVLYYRMAKVGRGRMPYLGSSEVDPRGLQLMHDWIEDLGRQRSSPIATGPSPNPSSYHRLIQQLSDERGPDVRARLEELLRTTSGALALQQGLDGGRVPAPVRQVAVDLGVSHAEIQVRDLFERFVPPERRTKRLGAAIDPQEILKLAGDAARGRRLFLESDTVACKNCHQVAGKGTPLGPDLTQLAKKYNRSQLLETILNPSQTIDPKFATYLVETRDGQVLSGLLAARDDQFVLLKDSQAKEIRIPTRDIEFIAPQQKSLMPELLVQDLTAQQVADLLAFLASL
jgi:putative heme-binding domain-containing protein